MQKENTGDKKTSTNNRYLKRDIRFEKSGSVQDKRFSNKGRQWSVRKQSMLLMWLDMLLKKLFKNLCDRLQIGKNILSPLKRIHDIYYATCQLG